MAAITPKTGGPYAKFVALQSAATGTTTDWLDVPEWANAVRVHLRVTAAGTNTILTIKGAHPTVRDDGTAITLVTSATITATGYHTYTLTPSGTAVADSATVSTGVVAAASVPKLIGVTTTPTGSTYSTDIEFLKL